MPMLSTTIIGVVQIAEGRSKFTATEPHRALIPLQGVYISEMTILGTKPGEASTLAVAQELGDPSNTAIALSDTFDQIETSLDRFGRLVPATPNKPVIGELHQELALAAVIFRRYEEEHRNKAGISRDLAKLCASTGDDSATAYLDAALRSDKKADANGEHAARIEALLAR